MKDKKRLIDVCLIAGLLLFSGVLYLAMNAGREVGGWIVVRINGEVTERYALSDDGTYPLNNGSNILVIGNGEAWLSDANCPDKLCVHQGKIRYTGEVIVCLPNRLTVTVEDGENNGVDIVVG